MKSISFKNFRRFADFPEFKFGDITILVGGNNAGKSTLLKALILLVDNLRELKSRNESVFNSFWPTFSFDMNHIHQLNLGTYSRAHKLGTKEGITFECVISHFKISFKVDALNDTEANSPSATLTSILIIDTNRSIEFWFSPDNMGVRFNDIVESSTAKQDTPVVYYHELLEKLEAAKADEDIALIASLNVEIEKMERVMQQMSVPQQFGGADSRTVMAPASNYVDLLIEHDLTIPSNPVAKLLYHWIGYQSFKPGLAKWQTVELDDDARKEAFLNKKQTFAEMLAQGSDPYEENAVAIQEGEFTIEDHEANHQFLEDKISVIREIAQELNNALYRLNEFNEVFYIQAQAITQRVLYSIDNRNDYMAQVLHEFVRENIQQGTGSDRFLKKWLALFGIGTNYRVKSIEGEGYTLEIETKDGLWQHLADLGMGSNQLVTLLMELATLLKVKGNRQYPLIIVEEPEQNLHPMVQSHLADLFSALNKERGFKFLIETHSEYLIRRTQVLVAEMNLTAEELEKQNPFKVYYFPENGTPYDMKYREDGCFANEFGSGFFDEASNLAFKLF